MRCVVDDDGSLQLVFQRSSDLEQQRAERIGKTLSDKSPKLEVANSLTPLAQFTLEAADETCTNFDTEAEFFGPFNQKVVLLRTEGRDECIGDAMAEIVKAGLWPWRRT
jgi:hypothetical protein